MTHTREVWMPVLGYEGVYEVSNLGRVSRDGRILAQADALYPHLSLSLNGDIKTHRVHKLVLTAFCGPAPFIGAEAAHNNGDTSNCKLTNLRWASKLENQDDVDRHGRRCKGEAVYGAVLSEPQVVAIRRRVDAGERNRPVAEDFGVSISTVHLIRHRRIWKHVKETTND